MKIVGFTGTQVGMTQQQERALRYILEVEQPEQFHHGNCVGADEQAARLAMSLGITTIAHCGDNPEKQSKLVSDITIAPKDNMDRNHDIVDVCEMLIATPKGAPQLRSGTWATIRYAETVNRHTLIITPNGEIV